MELYAAVRRAVYVEGIGEELGDAGRRVSVVETTACSFGSFPKPKLGKYLSKVFLVLQLAIDNERAWVIYKS